MKRDLTLARIRNTDFPILYKKFILDCEITKLELKKILTIATIFLNSTNQNIQNLYTIDLICHGSPSPNILFNYLKNKKRCLQSGKVKNKASDRGESHLSDIIIIHSIHCEVCVKICRK